MNIYFLVLINIKYRMQPKSHGFSCNYIPFLAVIDENGNQISIPAF